jgi:hypothetical protein
MSEFEWTPKSKIEELFAATAGNKFSSINSPVAGARVEKELDEGSAPVQLYSLATPNGMFNFIILAFLVGAIFLKFYICL